MDVSVRGYFRPDGLLNMEAILSDFEEYIMQIGVNAFYKSRKPYENTGQFMLTSWLYQYFITKEKSDELSSRTVSERIEHELKSASR